MNKLKLTLAIAAIALLAAPVRAQVAQYTVPLYNGAIPGNKPSIEVQEAMLPTADTTLVHTVTPRLVIYKPAAQNDARTAMVVCPGGGYQSVCYGFEGRRIGLALAKRGITSFVLIYRLPSDAVETDKSIAPLQDAQRALQYARENAAKYNVDPAKIGAMGFSAGGHLASTLGTHYGKAYIDNPKGTSLRPDFMILVYPVISSDMSIAHRGSIESLIGNDLPADKARLFSNELQVTADTPPTFITQATDDKVVPVQNSLVFYNAMLAHKRPVEMHLYQKGDHGFLAAGAPTLDEWLDRAMLFLKLQGFVK